MNLRHLIDLVETMTSPRVDLYEMANYYPEDTGLPMCVWVSQRGGARHDVRVKVSQTYGKTMNVNDTAVVGLRPEVRLIKGHLDTQDFRLVKKWMLLNQSLLISLWDGDISFKAFSADMKSI